MKEQIKTLLDMLTGFGSQKMEEIGIAGFLFVIFVALVCSVFVSFLYVYFFSQRATGSQVHRAFPLLGISVTGIFICIQFSLPLSLGLLGALSIVRFRTPIKEPEEVGFIMLVIAVSIACATFNFVFVGLLLLVAVLACLATWFGPRILKESIDDGVLMVTLPHSEYSSSYPKLVECLDRRVRRGRIESLARNGGEAVLSYGFSGLKRDSLAGLQSDLDALLGPSSYSIFFNRPGAP